MRGSLVLPAGTQLQDLLGERWTIIRLVGLVADDRQCPPKPSLPQSFRGAKPGQRGADNDDAAVGL